MFRRVFKAGATKEADELAWLRRLKAALDAVSTNVMVADAEHRIIYANDAVVRMFRNAEDDIRRDIPSFRADAILGSTIDVFHKVPAKNRKIVDGLRGQHHAEITPGGHPFTFVATAIVDESGRRIGTGVEWTDLTLVTKVRTAIDQITISSRELVSGSADLSQRTEMQASGLEQTASSMEQFTATVKQNAASSQEANALGTAAMQKARAGGAVMGDVVATMNNIRESAEKIVEIISVIDGIAFQTNILALNAAVEAARAGEQGRGFAVVAGEVRALAQRSASAAKEIKALIDDTVSKVQNGSHLVEQAGETMGDLVESVQHTTEILQDIASASREQSMGIDQVNKAITQMDELTQQNAALAEQTAAAVGNLEEQTAALAGAINDYLKRDDAEEPEQQRLPRARPAALTSSS